MNTESKNKTGQGWGIPGAGILAVILLIGVYSAAPGFSSDERCGGTGGFSLASDLCGESVFLLPEASRVRFRTAPSRSSLDDISSLPARFSGAIPSGNTAPDFHAYMTSCRYSELRGTANFAVISLFVHYLDIPPWI